MSDMHLIVVHGRSIKPAGSALEAMAKRAVARGLERAGRTSAADKVEQGRIKFSSVYYGDINNEIEAKNSRKTRALLTARNDAGYTFRPCFPADHLDDAFSRTDKIATFGPAAYRRVLKEAEDWRMLDEAAEAASLFGNLLTFGLLNTFLISSVKSDLTAYLVSQVIGSQVRARLQSVLEPSLRNGDDICLVTHSMGCMVAYDVFWKYSFRSEYKKVREAGNPVKLWITMGCPLGETGVKRNLLDAQALADEKHPRKQFVDWVNIHAEDDFISHAESMRHAYSAMPRKRYCRTIRDRKIYNCWHYKDAKNGQLVSNPHDLYGYLINHITAGFIGQWVDKA